MNILITRPLIDAEDLMGKIFSLGHKIIHIPTLKISSAKTDPVNANQYNAFIFTSANAIRNLKVIKQDKTKLCFCVGAITEKIARMSKINQFHVSLFAEYVQKLQDTPEGEGSLLDQTLLLYGSGIGNPNIHDHTNLPVLVAGGSATGLKGGHHVRYKKPTPLSNLHLTLLDKAGVHLDSFADSTGKMEELFPLSI